MAPRKDNSGNARFSAPRTLRLLRQQRHRDTSSRRTQLVSGAHPVPCAKLTLGSRDTAAGAHGRRTGTCRSSPWGDAVQCSFLFSSCSGVAAFPTPRRWERIISCCGGSSDSKLCVCSNNRRQMPTLWARQELHLWLASLSKVNSFSRHRFRAQRCVPDGIHPKKRGEVGWLVANCESVLAISLCTTRPVSVPRRLRPSRSSPGPHQAHARARGHNHRVVKLGETEQ